VRRAVLLSLAVAVSGCTSMYTIDDNEFDSKTSEINGTRYGEDCFKDGYDTAYRFSCSGDVSDKEYKWIDCSDGEVVEFSEAIRSMCTVSEYGGGLP